MFGKALKKFRTANSLTREELAKNLGISRESVASYEIGRRRPDFDVILNFETAYRISIYELINEEPLTEERNKRLSEFYELYEKAPMYARNIVDYLLYSSTNEADRPFRFHSINGVQANGSFSIPVVGRAAAGVPIEMIREYDDTIDIAGPLKPGDFAVIAVGDSMTGDGIHDSDRVIIRKQDVVEDGELALVAVDGGSTIKRVHFNGKTIKLMPSNPAYKPQIYDFMHDVRILGKVIQVIKSSKV